VLQPIERDVGKVNAMLVVELPNSWHIQSNQPLADNLFATQVASTSRGWHLTRVEYPLADEVSLSFQDQPLSVWAGTINIPLELHVADPSSAPDPVLRLKVQLQACSDELCLLPETIQLELPARRLMG